MSTWHVYHPTTHSRRAVTIWPTSVAYDEALRAPNRRWSTRVEIIADGQQVSLTSSVLDGRVSVDETPVRRAAELTLLDTEGFITPESASDLLAPRGTEIRPWRGLEVGTGADGEPVVEWVPLGVFGIAEPSVTGGREGTTLRLRGFDRAAAVRARTFSAPWRTAAGTPTHVALADIVTTRFDCPTRLTASGHLTPEIRADAGDDPWKLVQDIAAGDGLLAYFDPLGTFVVEPARAQRVSMDYTVGEGGLLLGSERSITSEDTYSGVIVIGEHPDFTPVRTELWDTSPSSPTYHLGPFGRRPYIFRSEVIITQEMCDATAQVLLPRVTQMPQTISIPTLGHPGHEVGDIVTVDHEATRTRGSYAVSSVRIPLRVGDSVDLQLREA